VAPSLDRLSRSLQDPIGLVAELRRRQVGFRSLHEALDTTTPGCRLVFHAFAALAEFIRELTVEGTHEGLDAARTRGVRLGRPPARTPEQVRQARPAEQAHAVVERECGGVTVVVDGDALRVATDPARAPDLNPGPGRRRPGHA
jgi:DNA invertase Pin-like site-specific DNA recombinase